MVDNGSLLLVDTRLSMDDMRNLINHDQPCRWHGRCTSFFAAQNYFVYLHHERGTIASIQISLHHREDKRSVTHKLHTMYENEAGTVYFIRNIHSVVHANAL